MFSFPAPPLSLLAAAALVVCGAYSSTAQTAGTASQPVTAAEQKSTGAPLTVDPTLVLPVASLTPAQITGMQQKLADWPQLARYRESNAALAPTEPGRVVFYGDSITDAWGRYGNPPFFPGKPYVNRGISGQTTPQMLVRFQQDVVALKPAAVLILAGTNDIAGNTGLSTLAMTEDNLRSMVVIAKANGIRVILASLLPASDYPWRKGLHPAGRVRELNAWIKSYAAQSGSVYLDYHTALVDDDGGMKPGTSKDGVHPTPAGYAIMAPLAQAAVDQALR